MECLAFKKSNCKNCYKCIRHCPVKSIRFSGNQAYIMPDECILCGQCVVSCPQNAKEIVSEIEKVKVLLQGEEPVIVSLAPSFIANYSGFGIESMREAIKKLGFYDVEETAIGATIVKNEYERILEEDNRDIIITSCCHSVNLLIQKHFPHLLHYLADVVSPMQAHCKNIKDRVPNAKTVFVGPCVAKKDEAERYDGIVDAVLTFDELTSMLADAKVSVEYKDEDIEKSKARLFPTTGGVLKSMALDNKNYTYMAIDGTDNVINALRDIENNELHHVFIEMSACAGSCIGGPIMDKQHRSPVKDLVAVTNYAGSEDFDVEQPDKDSLLKPFDVLQTGAVMPTEDQIRDTLRQMGKTKPSDELNCGSCGYSTCREKAIAVFQGKAEVSMCLPYLKDKAESFSDLVVKNTPNGLIVVNEALEVQQINHAASKILNLRNPDDIRGDRLTRLMDPVIFVKALESGRNIYNQKEYLAEYDKYVEETVIYDTESRILLGIMKDITSEMNEKEEKEELRRKTVEIADKVVDKQMRIVQEIASLLGETAAETKIALTKLKESQFDE